MHLTLGQLQPVFYLAPWQQAPGSTKIYSTSSLVLALHLDLILFHAISRPWPFPSFCYEGLHITTCFCGKQAGRPRAW